MKITIRFIRKFLSAILIFGSFSAQAQQSLTSSLEEEAKTNKRLLPRYGLLQKSPAELAADHNFIEATMSQEQFNGDRRAASNHLIKLGFEYLYRRDPKTAMYRFNQAYLLDSTNADIYWGYGGYYMTLGNFEEGRKQYEEGLSIDPDNTHLLTDYATYFMNQQYRLRESGYEVDASTHLDSAVNYLEQSFKLDTSDQNTLFKLSICYWAKGDCEKAWSYFNKCKDLGGRPITEAYTADLVKKCGKPK